MASQDSMKPTGQPAYLEPLFPTGTIIHKHIYIYNACEEVLSLPLFFITVKLTNIILRKRGLTGRKIQE